MSDPFAILGVPRRFRLDLRSLEQRHRDLSRALHPDRHVQASPAERRAALERSAAVNDAFRALKNPQTRAAALLAAAGRTVEEHHRADASLLVEIMDLREALESVRSRSSCDRASAIQQLCTKVQAEIDTQERTIAEVFDHQDSSHDHDYDAPSLDRAHNAVIKLRYLYRFMEEAEAAIELEV